MVHPVELPAHALQQAYRAAGYTDGYATELPYRVSVAQFVEAFYTTPLFKLERWLLGAVLHLPSTDAQAKELAEGGRRSFAAWTVEARDEHQVLLAAGRTRSWLAVVPTDAAGTRLLFGSAVVPRRSASGPPSMGVGFRALVGFHRLYARALLRAARSRLRAQAGAAPGDAG